MKQSAPQGGAGSDDPTGRDRGRNRPVEHCGKCIVRTGSSNAVRIGSFDDLSLSASSSTTEEPSGARAGDLAVRERRRTRLERRPAAAAEPNGEGGKREAGRVRWAVGADCCGALGCRETEGLVVVVTDRGERVLCLDCVEGWLG